MNDWISGKEQNIHAWLYISTYWYAQIIQRMGQAGFEQQKCEAHEMIQGGKLNLFFFDFFGEVEMDLLYGLSIHYVNL